MTRHQFSDQLNSNLRSVQASPRHINQLLQSCGADQSRSPDFGEKPTQYVVQVVMSDGTVCADPGGVKYSITAADVAVAAGELDSVIHDTESQDGTKMRVSTERVPGAPSDIAISIAQPLERRGHATQEARSLFVGNIWRGYRRHRNIWCCD